MTRLPRSHRLKRRRLIRPLFDRSRSDVQQASVGCVRVLYRRVDRGKLPVSAPVQVGFVVGRRAGGAVVRNRIRRQMREAYRLGKGPLLDMMGTRDFALTAMFVYRDRTRESTAPVRDDFYRLLNLVVQRLSDSQDH